MADQDWRLRLDLDEPADLDHLISSLRQSSNGRGDDVEHALGDDVALTHDGGALFAYSAGETPLEHARGTIESLLGSEQRTAKISVCHWENAERRWRQIEPPLTDVEEEEQIRATHRADVEAEGADAEVETRAVMCTIGKLIRKSFEQQMIGFAQSIEVQCAIVEHPHLLSTQVAFTVTGTRGNVDAFERYLKSEARMTCRMDLGAIPFGLP
jgi:hypothetical protein